MYRVYGCIIDQHDIRLVLLAALICVLTAGTTFGIYSRVAHARGGLRTMWLLVTGVCAASGIWATHFVAMLAYEDNIPTAYDPSLTAGSLIIAIIATTVGFAVCARGGVRYAGVGGAIVGLGISLHFTGMQALVVAGHLEWDWTYVAVAVVLGIVLGAASTVAYEKLAPGRVAIAAGAVLLTLAICAMHFTAMAAAIIVPDPTVSVTTGFSADATMMALAIAGLVGLVIFAGITAALIDHRTTQVNIDQVRELVDAASEGILICRDGVIVNANRRIAEICGQPVGALVGKRVGADLLLGLHFGDSDAAPNETEAAIHGADGRLTPVEVMRRPFRSGLRANEVYAIRDLSERYRSEAKIAHMTRHDPVTDLPNRVLLRERLEQALHTRRRDEHVAVLCLDLSRFKSINDAFGRVVGDALLRKVARRLLACVRDSDTVARIGADEFVIIQCCPDPWRQAADLAERIIGVVGSPYVIKGQDVRVATSVGIAVPAAESITADDLLGRAETALHAAKAIGRGSYLLFEPEMNAQAHERHEMERALRLAMQRGELELFYQPFVDLERLEVCGAEALMRWRHPERGLITPDRFIPIAEETGLIIEMGAWALREACAEAVGWPSGIKLAVNLSPVQFSSPRLVETVHEALAASGLAFDRLELEVTESVLLQDSQPTLAALGRLHDLGIGVSMDDFGTGYSSLSYLQKFAFDKIKIDRCFLSNAQPKETQAVIRAICGLGEALQLAVTAEGVETAEQLELVRSEGCVAAQGYYFSPPVSAEALRAMLPASTRAAHAA